MWPAIILASSVLYVLFLVESRPYLSPLSNFPGPKLAALSRWYHTSVGLTYSHLAHDASVFPDSRTFNPDHWLATDGNSEDEKLNRDMDRWFVPFGKGSRSCLGINLATAETHLAMATLVARYDFELFETDVSYVELKHDFFVPSAKLGSKGVRVIVGQAGT
jgi:hypothetical protein